MIEPRDEWDGRDPPGSHPLIPSYPAYPAPSRRLLSFSPRSVNVAPMPGEPRKSKRFDPPLSEIQARQMGELQRGDSRWDVLIEFARDDEIGALRGRIHFVSGSVHRVSAWIFLEWSAKDIEARFGEFSAQELWNLLDSLS
jgi:hypothetical protein